MPLGLSAYLDFIRVGAALMVLMNHVWPWFMSIPILPFPAHHAVIVFFVLSGFVVDYVTTTKENNFSAYALSRAARILSVTVPALAIATAIALAVGIAPREVWYNSVLNFFFIAESWSLAVLPQIDPPYWSLCYEVWYYAIFAAAMFAPGRWAKAAWLVPLCLCAGPKILVLMPCWLAGVALHRYAGRITLSARSCWALFIASLALYAPFYWFDVSVQLRHHLYDRFPDILGNLDGSNQVAGDYILTLIVVANFLAVYHMQGGFPQWFAHNRRIFQRVASNTLSIYLFHYPAGYVLLHLGLKNWLGLPLTIAICLVLAPFTEHRKSQLRRFLQAAITRAPSVPRTAA